jgi:putative two-component system response regulator
VEDAAQLLREGCGKHFDPDCVAAFFKVFDEVREIKGKYLDEGVEIRDRALD